ncbi:MAG: glycosyltransferase family 4 protein [Nitriliruptoraceae bacterium]
MRIAIVSPYDLDVPGGVQSHVRLLAAALRRSGEEVIVVGAGTPGVRREEREVTVGASRGVAFNGSVAPIALSAAAARRTRQVLADLAPDVVHVHEPLVPAVGVAAATTDVAPRVLTFHAWSDSDLAYRAVRPVARRVVAGATAWIAVSPAAARYHGAALGVDEGRFDVIPNGVEVAPFAAAADAVAAAAPNVPPRLVFVGRLEPRKGVLILAEAYLQVRQRLGSVGLTVVGDGPQRARLEAVLAGVTDGEVHLAGRVTGPELAAALASADVAVAPALGGESFGIVLLEAMAARTAVVASDIPGYRSVVEHGHNGVLVAPDDPEALAEALVELLRDPAGRAARVAAGVATAERHDWSVVAARLQEVYRRVCGRTD